MSHEPRLVEVRKNILKQNDLNARELRQRFHDGMTEYLELLEAGLAAARATAAARGAR